MVRNPMLALAGVAALRQLSPDVRKALRAVLVELANDARARLGKLAPPHSAHGACSKVAAVYAGHLARVPR